MDICLDKRIILNRYLYVIFKIHDSDMLIFSCAYTCCTLIPNTPPIRCLLIHLLLPWKGFSFAPMNLYFIYHKQ